MPHEGNDTNAANTAAHRSGRDSAVIRQMEEARQPLVPDHILNDLSSVQVSEFIVQPRLKSRIQSSRYFRRGRNAMSQSYCGKYKSADCNCCCEVRNNPSEPIESSVGRRGQEVLPSILPDKSLDNLIPILTLVDLLAKLRAHLCRATTHAFCQRFVGAPSTEATYL